MAFELILVYKRAVQALSNELSRFLLTRPHASFSSSIFKLVKTGIATREKKSRCELFWLCVCAFGALFKTPGMSGPPVRCGAVGSLSWAAYHGCSTVVEDLVVNQGADKDEADNEGKTPLHIAAGAGFRFGVMQCLLKHGADKDKTNAWGETPLFVAAKWGYFAMVQCLVEHGADKDKTSLSGESPLHVAALWAFFMVLGLVKKGVDIKKADQFGESPLYAASYRGHVEVFRYLVEQGADTDCANKVGLTPLVQICSAEWPEAAARLDMAECLLEHGCAKDRGDMQGATALHWAARRGDVALATLLRRYGANLDAQATYGETAMFDAAQHGQLEMVQYLVKEGADMHKATMFDGRTPFTEACRQGHANVAEYLLDQGVTHTHTHPHKHPPTHTHTQTHAHTHTHTHTHTHKHTHTNTHTHEHALPLRISHATRARRIPDGQRPRARQTRTRTPHAIRSRTPHAPPRTPRATRRPTPHALGRGAVRVSRFGCQGCPVI